MRQGPKPRGEGWGLAGRHITSDLHQPMQGVFPRWSTVSSDARVVGPAGLEPTTPSL